MRTTKRAASLGISFCGVAALCVAAGVALVEAASGFVLDLKGAPIQFNSHSALLSGLVAGGCRLREHITSFLAEHIQTP